MKNSKIAELFRKMGLLLEIKGEIIFKTRAYLTAAENISNLTQDIEDLVKTGGLDDIPGIGRALHDKIVEYCNTGKISAYEKLIDEIPESLLDVVNIPTVGPKKAKLFFEELKIKDVDALLAAALDGTLLQLPGIKQKTVDNIIDSINIFKQGVARVDIATADELACEIVGGIKKLKCIESISVVGSLRRFKETIKDVDILVVSDTPDEVMNAFVKLPQVKSVIVFGKLKTSVFTHQNIQVDLRVFNRDLYGSAMLYFTGSQSFNIALRQKAKSKDMKVNEYGIFRVEKDGSETLVASKTEKDCFTALSLPYVPPELREDLLGDEVFDKVKNHKLIKESHIKGDLHVHSTWSDGKNSIEEIVVACIRRGYEYVAISDHSESLKVASGLSRERLAEKRKEIEFLNKKYKEIKILFGVEVEIDKDGNLDYNSASLSEFDVVIAAVHTSLTQNPEAVTARIVKACNNKYVNIIAHPTCVHHGKRAAIDIDLKAVSKAAADNNVFLEINSFPVRLDLNSVNAHFCGSHKAKFVINTDAHSINHLDYMKYGVGVANRAWLTGKDILNTNSFEEMSKLLKK